MAKEMTSVAFDTWQSIRDEDGLGDIVGIGVDGSPTNRADAVVEAALLEVAEREGISILSEESGLTDHGSDSVAVVDPLDGSRNAARGIPMFCSSVAIGPVDGGLKELEAGSVRHLVTGQHYFAKAGEGATVDGKPVRRRTFDATEVMVGGTTLDDFVIHEAMPGQYYRDLGSAALDLCLVGTGALDAFLVRAGWLRVVDIAAGVLFVREAGGTVLDPTNGEHLQMRLNMDERGSCLAVHHESALEGIL